MGKIRGTNLVIATRTSTTATRTIVACGTSCSIDISANCIEVAGTIDGTSRNYVAGRKDWSIASEHILSQGDLASLSSLVGTKVYVSFYDKNASNGLEGEAIVKKVSANGKRGSWSSYSMSFQGCGALSSF